MPNPFGRRAAADAPKLIAIRFGSPVRLGDRSALVGALSASTPLLGPTAEDNDDELDWRWRGGLSDVLLLTEPRRFVPDDSFMSSSSSSSSRRRFSLKRWEARSIWEAEVDIVTSSKGSVEWGAVADVGSVSMSAFESSSSSG